jgi:hypothetical protein
VPTTALVKIHSFGKLRTGPSASSGQGAKYNTGLPVYGPESVIVTPFYAMVSRGARRASRPNGQMPRAGYDYFVASVPAVVLLDKGTAGNEHCQYCNYDGDYERFHFSTPFLCFVGFELSFEFSLVLY